MAAIREKRNHIYMSLGAIALSVAFTGWLWYRGASQPRKYVSAMTINHHVGYGKSADCLECHTPKPGTFGLMSSMTCYTARCHGEFMPGTPRDKQIAMSLHIYSELPETEERTAHYLDLHKAVMGEDCTACHSEHKPHAAPVYPAGWDSYDIMKAKRESVSVMNKQDKEIASASPSQQVTQ